MSEPISIDLSTTGDHVTVPGLERAWISLSKIILTCAVPDGGTMTISWKSGSTIKFGPFHMQNGGTLTIPSVVNPLMKCEQGEPLITCLSGDAGKIGGTIFVDRGSS